MRLQVLLSAMNQKDHSILDKAGIRTDAIVINQSNEFKKEVFEYKGHKIQFLTFDERGVGLSRNNALMRSDADIILFADEDIEYDQNYDSIIIEEFKNNPKADMIVFNVPSRNPLRPTYIIPKKSRVRTYNCLRYGAVKMAVRADRLKQKNVYFSLLFGGGAKYSSGEDSIFISNVIKSGLRVYACPSIIGYVDQADSTWFKGYSDKYFRDKGALFAYLSPRFGYLLGLQFVIRKYKSFKIENSFSYVLGKVFRGISEVNGNR